MSSIRSSDHHFALFLTQSGTDSANELPDMPHGICDSEIILWLR